MERDPQSGQLSWLHDRLGSGSGLDVVYRSFRPSPLGEGDPWRSGSGLDELEGLSAKLRDLESQTGRLVVVTDLEEDPTRRVHTAIQLARLLGDRQRVVLVDADFRQEGLAAYLDRSDEEGWVDLVRYGASVQAATRTAMVENIWTMGVGSYRPDVDEPLQDEELRRGLSQLRSGFDFVLMLCPAWQTNGRFHPLLVHADTVLLSLRLHRALGPALDELMDYLEGLGVPMGGIVVYAGLESMDLTVDQRLVEERVPSAAMASSPTPGRTEPAAPEPAPAEIARTGNEEGQGAPQDTGRRDSLERSSPVLRWAVALAAIVLIVFVAWWGRTLLSGRSASMEREPLALGSKPAPGPAGSASMSTEPGATGAAEPASEGPDRQGVASLVAELAPKDEIASTVADSSTVPSTESETEAARNIAQAGPEAGANPRPAGEPSQTHQLSPLEVMVHRPVGPGYALHVWSFADSLEAVTAIHQLQRDGFAPAIRTTVKDGRTWYRVLIGRFATRREALDARPLLSSRKDVSYVGVVGVH